MRMRESKSVGPQKSYSDVVNSVPTLSSLNLQKSSLVNRAAEIPSAQLYSEYVALLKKYSALLECLVQRHASWLFVSQAPSFLETISPSPPSSPVAAQPKDELQPDAAEFLQPVSVPAFAEIPIVQPASVAASAEIPIVQPVQRAPTVEVKRAPPVAVEIPAPRVRVDNIEDVSCIVRNASNLCPVAVPKPSELLVFMLQMRADQEKWQEEFAEDPEEVSEQVESAKKNIALPLRPVESKKEGMFQVVVSKSSKKKNKKKSKGRKDFEPLIDALSAVVEDPEDLDADTYSSSTSRWRDYWTPEVRNAWGVLEDF